jgi:flagellar basal-body rod protein FlgB
MRFLPYKPQKNISNKRFFSRWHFFCSSSSKDSFYAQLKDHLMAGIDGTIDLLQAGIKAEHLRQKAIASNIANLETPGYRRVDIKSAHNIDIEDIEPEIFRPYDTPIKSNGNDVSLEAEIGKMVENSMRHKAYVRLLSKKFQQMQQAIETP